MYVHPPRDYWLLGCDIMLFRSVVKLPVKLGWGSAQLVVRNNVNFLPKKPEDDNST